jgi:hypothetical protein
LIAFTISPVRKLAVATGLKGVSNPAEEAIKKWKLLSTLHWADGIDSTFSIPKAGGSKRGESTTSEPARMSGVVRELIMPRKR